MRFIVAFPVSNELSPSSILLFVKMMLFLKMFFFYSFGDIVPVRKRFSLFKLCRANQPLEYWGEAVIKIRYYIHGRKTAKFCPLL